MGLGSAGIDVTSMPIGASVQTAEAYWEKTSTREQSHGLTIQQEPLKPSILLLNVPSEAMLPPDSSLGGASAPQNKPLEVLKAVVFEAGVPQIEYFANQNKNAIDSKFKLRAPTKATKE